MPAPSLSMATATATAALLLAVSASTGMALSQPNGNNNGETVGTIEKSGKKGSQHNSHGKASKKGHGHNGKKSSSTNDDEAIVAPPRRRSMKTTAKSLVEETDDAAQEKKQKVADQQIDGEDGEVVDGADATAASAAEESTNDLMHEVDDISRRNQRGYNRERRERERAGRMQSTYKSISELRGGVCPANGNTHVLYVSTHVGTNIESYDTFGKFLGPLINRTSVPDSVGLQKLRGMVYGPDGLLYVAASRASFSRIFAISPTGVPLPLRKKSSHKGFVAEQDVSGGNGGVSDGGVSSSSYQNQLPGNPRENAFNTPGYSASSSSATGGSSSNLGDSINRNLLAGRNGGGVHVDQTDEELLFNQEHSKPLPYGGNNNANTNNQNGNGAAGDYSLFTNGYNGLNDGAPSKYLYKYDSTTGGSSSSSSANGGEWLLSPSAPELTFLSGEQRMAATLPSRYRMNEDCTRNYVYTLAKLDGESNPNMNHPYSFFFHPEDGTMFVTNQNSITVTRYVGPTTSKKQVLDIMAATAGVLHRTPKLTASLKSLLKKLAPVEPSDPVPYAGGVSGYAGMPLPPSYTILNALRLIPDDNRTAASSAAGRYSGGVSVGTLNANGFFNDDMGAGGNTNANNQQQQQQQVASSSSSSSSKKTSTTSTTTNDDNIPSHIPSKAIGVFAAGWCPFYNMLSVRGMAISPKMLYSVTDRMFVHDMEVVPLANTLGGGAAGAGGNIGGGNMRRSSATYGESAAVSSSSSDSAVGSLSGGIFGAIGDILFGHKANKAAANNAEAMTIRRRVDLSTKTVIALRVILVADVIGNSVHVLHEHTGELMWSYVNVVRQPIQIHFPKAAERTSTSGDFWFYVTCKGGAVYKLHLRRPASASSRTSVAILIRPGQPMKAVSGFFENPSHNTLYIADRKGRAIHTYSTPDDQSQAKELHYTGKFAISMVGEPEHILFTSVTQQHNIPYCYELSHDGSLRYTALCLAWQLWVLAAIGGVVIGFFVWTRVGRSIASSCCGWANSATGGAARRRRRGKNSPTDSHDEQ